MGGMLQGLLHRKRYSPGGAHGTIRSSRFVPAALLTAGFLGLITAGCSRQTVAPEPVVVPPMGAVPATGVENRTSSIPVTAVEWSRSPWKPRVAAREWAYVVIHHTATDAGSVESIHQAHVQRRDAAGNPWRGIGYHFVVGNGRGMEDGDIEPTFRWREQLAGAHAGIGAYNRQGIGICLVGNFEKHPPSLSQLTSLKRLVSQLTAKYGIPPEQVVRHRDVKATDCPGKLFPMQELIQVSYSASVR